MIQTFDIWDTTITRAVGSPAGVFWLLGWQLESIGLTQLPPEELVQLRREAERCERQKTPGGEPALVEIYDELASLAGWTQQDAGKVREREVKLEHNLSRVVPASLETIAVARKQQKSVRFISDIYLSASDLEAIWKKAGAWMEGDRCYDSCEACASKRSSRLFRLLLRQKCGTAALHESV